MAPVSLTWRGACLVNADLLKGTCLPSSGFRVPCGCEGLRIQGLAHWPPLLAAKSKRPGGINHCNLTEFQLFPAEPFDLKPPFILNTHHCPEISSMTVREQEIVHGSTYMKNNTHGMVRWLHDVNKLHATEFYT